MQENRRQAEEKDREELMQRVTTDDEFRLLVNQYDAEAGAKSTQTVVHLERKKIPLSILFTYLTYIYLFLPQSLSSVLAEWSMTFSLTGQAC